jgi:hypothetical protein
MGPEESGRKTFKIKTRYESMAENENWGRVITYMPISYRLLLVCVHLHYQNYHEYNRALS